VRLPETVRVEPLSVRIPPVRTSRWAVVMASEAPEVLRFVVLAPSETVRVLPTTRPRVLMVKLWAVPAEEVRVRLKEADGTDEVNLVTG